MSNTLPVARKVVALMVGLYWFFIVAKALGDMILLRNVWASR